MDDCAWAAQSTADRLYALLEERLREQGEGLPCAMPALSAYAASAKGEIDCLRLAGLDNRSFFEACYLIAFDCLPPEHFVRAWEKEMDALPREAFREKFLRAFVLLPDYGRLSVRLIHCPYIDQGGLLQQRRALRLRGRVYDLLRPLYLRLPAPLRAFLKRALHKLLLAG